jgi:hypothetical protein
VRRGEGDRKGPGQTREAILMKGRETEWNSIGHMFRKTRSMCDALKMNSKERKKNYRGKEETIKWLDILDCCCMAVDCIG